MVFSLEKNHPFQSMIPEISGCTVLEKNRECNSLHIHYRTLESKVKHELTEPLPGESFFGGFLDAEAI